MKRVTVTELRNSLASVMRRVAEGEEIVVTSRGKAIARIVPAEDPRLEHRRALEELRARSWVGDVLTPIRGAWDACRRSPEAGP